MLFPFLYGEWFTAFSSFVLCMALWLLLQPDSKTAGEYLRTAYFEHYQVLPNLTFHLEMKNAHAFLPCELGIIWNSVFNRKQNKIYIALKN